MAKRNRRRLAAYEASRPRMLVRSRDMSFGVSTMSSKKCGLCGRPSETKSAPGKRRAQARHQRHLADAGAVDEHDVDRLAARPAATKATRSERSAAW